MVFKKIFIICPTYRIAESEKLRLFGVVSLIKQIKEQKGNYDIKLAIVDSSLKIHPFFNNYKNKNEWLLYLHLPSRNNIDNYIKTNFSDSLNFIPNDFELKSLKWNKIINKAVAWDNYFPWDDNYPLKDTIKEQIFRDRPTIGMKRNFAISILMEKFGEADYIVYADDDDFRSDSYIDNLVIGIKNADFGRFFKYYTYAINKNIWGLFDAKFNKDANLNWFLSDKNKDFELKNNLDTRFFKYNNTLKQKYSKLICLTFPPISFEGATHIFKYKLWKESLKEFGGIPITSICEDVLFYKQCKCFFGKDFKDINIKIKDINFLRIGGNTNSSVIEWIKDKKEESILIWARNYIKKYKEIQNIDITKYFINLSNNFIKNNEILL